MNVSESSNTKQDDSKPNVVWDRPWSTEEIRNSSRSWTLAGDAGLLNKLQEIAQKLVSNTHSVQQEVDSLIHETKNIHSKVHNVMNDFLMLSNTQFVESRVYDEEIGGKLLESEKSVQHVNSVTKEQNEADIVNRVSSALTLGLSVFPLEVQAKLSDEETETTSSIKNDIWKKKDPYYQRNLPFVIGTEAFTRDNLVGIGTFSSDHDTNTTREINVANKRIESDVDVNNVDIVVASEDYYNDVKNDVNIDESSDLFGEEAYEDANDTDFIQPAVKKELISNSDLSKHVQKASIIGHADNIEENDDKNFESEFSRSTSIKAALEKRFAENNMDEVDNAFNSSHDSNNMFSENKGGGGLFDNESEEWSDLFAENKKVSKVKEDKKKLKTDNVFEDSKHAQNDITSVPKSHSLFDEIDGENDLFTSEVPAASPSISTNKNKKANLLFDDQENESEDLFFSLSKDKVIIKEETKSENRKLPPGAEAPFGSGFNSDLLSGLTSAIKARSSSLSSNKNLEDSDWIESDQPKSSPVSVKPSQPSARSNIVSEIKNDSKSKGSSVSGLFSEEPDNDDLFASTFIHTGSKIGDKKPSSGPSLFDDDDNFNDGADLFSTSNTKKRTVIESKSQKPSEILVDKNVNKSKEGLGFLEDTSKIKTKTVENSSLFSDELEDSKNVLFSNKISLFDGKNEPEIKSDKLFDEVKVKQPEKTYNLFDDDDVLFGSGQTDIPEVDLFGSVAKQPFAASSKKELITEEASKAKTSTEVKTSNESSKSQIKVSEQNTASSSSSSSTREKPFGGVKLFGGILTDSKLKSPVSSPQKNVPDVNEHIPQVPKRAIENKEAAALSFDSPPEISTLHSANKERIKIQVKRRPPSRKGREDALRKSSIDIVPEITKQETSSRSAPTSPVFPDSHIDDKRLTSLNFKANIVNSPSTEEEDLFSVGNINFKDDIESDNSIFSNSLMNSSKETLKKNSSDNVKHLFGEPQVQPVKGISEIKKSSPEKTIAGKTSILDDKLVLDLPKASTSLFDNLDSDSNDTFASIMSKKNDSQISSVKSQKSNINSLFSDDEDEEEDIFKDCSSTNTVKYKSPESSDKKKLSLKSKPVLESKDDFDDLFEDPLMVNTK